MIVLEFRFQDNFQKASGLLKNHRIPCVAEWGMEACRPSYIFMFEDALRTEPQKKALGLARGFEQEDRRRQAVNPQANLAFPS